MVDINLYSDGQDFVINKDEEIIKQQIDILFDTKFRELLGQANYGNNFETFLYNMNISNDAIAYHIENELVNINLFGYEPEVSVNILEGTLNDIIIVKVDFRRKGQYFEKTYVLK